MLHVKLMTGVSESKVLECERLLESVELSETQLCGLLSLLTQKKTKKQSSVGRPSKSKKLVEVGGDVDVFSQLLSMGLPELSLVTEASVSEASVKCIPDNEDTVNNANELAKLKKTKQGPPPRIQLLIESDNED